MDWHDEALAEINKTPPFVRKLARQAVERRVAAAGREVVTLPDVRAAKPGKSRGDGTPAEFEALVGHLRTRAEELTVEADGYVLRCCAGAVGCPRAVVDVAALREEALRVLTAADLGAALRAKHGKGPLLLHHKLKVALAGCPNACSEPQIRDFGVIGRSIPTQSDAPCTECEACTEACHEGAVRIDRGRPAVDPVSCVACGDCTRACPTGRLVAGRQGYTLLLGGHLGRHPQLAAALPELLGAVDVANALRRSLALFVREMRPGERFSAVVQRMGAAYVAGAHTGGGETT